MSTEGKNQKSNSKDTTYNADVTKHDLEMLGQDHIHGDGGDDQQLKERAQQIDFSGKNLDVPGSNKAKKNQGPSKLKDEENKLYSQGGDSNENLERDDASKG
ncbi:hypothetical protein [Marixanthomonas spongiae]|uniref:Uncharacterized protein n=1 Tax=Marixanthomonas spongiae TaxID=2174845 RepID=A0A2U0HWG3_9FLAO|nr:hypothetical protein [Marixanthomonas spongiae]PVW13211.1 hypothetical protein DDV96_13990 [Marixanthomonas spongiae]